MAMESAVLSQSLVKWCLAGALMTAGLSQAQAREIVVHMKNNGAEGAMVFEPSFVKAAVGDTIKFMPTDKTHNAETIATMLPDGAAPAVGKINETLVVKVDKPGLWGFKCKPHYTMGMVALVQVGAKPANLAAARAAKLPPIAQKRMTAMLAKVK